jgi:hypothetical protein
MRDIALQDLAKDRAVDQQRDTHLPLHFLTFLALATGSSDFPAWLDCYRPRCLGRENVIMIIRIQLRRSLFESLVVTLRLLKPHIGIAAYKGQSIFSTRFGGGRQCPHLTT